MTDCLDRCCRALRLLLPAALVLLGPGCNDLTEPLPRIEGTYEYVTTSLDFAALNRTGIITIVDLDPRSARFEGTFEYRTLSGTMRSGHLIGAFVTRQSVWFNFLDETQVIHEGELLLGSGSGQLFFQGLDYEPLGASFTLRRR